MVYGRGHHTIYNNNENAKIIIGDETKTVNTQAPIIYSENDLNEAAISTSSTLLYFYNGTIQNGNDKLYNQSPIVREGYKIVQETDEVDNTALGGKIKLYIQYLERK